LPAADVASTLQQSSKKVMVEKQSINGKEVWLKVDPYHVERANRNIIPTEYFTATCYMQEPASGSPVGELVTDEDGEPKLFESPVAALAFARKNLEKKIQMDSPRP
jgi:hypothetical protein